MGQALTAALAQFGNRLQSNDQQELAQRLQERQLRQARLQEQFEQLARVEREQNRLAADRERTLASSIGHMSQSLLGESQIRREHDMRRKEMVQRADFNRLDLLRKEKEFQFESEKMRTQMDLARAQLLQRGTERAEDTLQGYVEDDARWQRETGGSISYSPKVQAEIQTIRERRGEVDRKLANKQISLADAALMKERLAREQLTLMRSNRQLDMPTIQEKWNRSAFSMGFLGPEFENTFAIDDPDGGIREIISVPSDRQHQQGVPMRNGGTIPAKTIYESLIEAGVNPIVADDWLGARTSGDEEAMAKLKPQIDEALAAAKEGGGEREPDVDDVRNLAIQEEVPIVDAAAAQRAFERGDWETGEAILERARGKAAASGEGEGETPQRTQQREGFFGNLRNNVAAVGKAITPGLHPDQPEPPTTEMGVRVRFDNLKGDQANLEDALERINEQLETVDPRTEPRLKEEKRRLQRQLQQNITQQADLARQAAEIR